MPILFICFIVFIFWMNVKGNHEKRKTSTWDQNYWAREKEANFTRKKDISDLDYIQISEEELPFSTNVTDKERDYQEQVKKCLTKKMLNLSDMTNTDIKLKYGTANFQILSVYDQNFVQFIRNLNTWAHYIHTEHPEEDARTEQILQLAISLGSDISDTYLTLADIYKNRDDLEKIQELIQRVELSDFYMKDSICEKLKAYVRAY